MLASFYHLAAPFIIEAYVFVFVQAQHSTANQATATEPGTGLMLALCYLGPKVFWSRSHMKSQDEFWFVRSAGVGLHVG